MAALVRVILSARAAWVVANDIDVEENVRIASMMVRKSQVEIVIYYEGSAKVLGPATSVGVVLGAEGSGGAKEARAVGKGAGTEESGT